MIKRLIFTFVLLFLLGWFSNSVYSDISESLDKFQNDQTGQFMAGDAVLKEKPSPRDRISEDQIQVYNDRVVIDMNNP